jgi:hypothetical protein
VRPGQSDPYTLISISFSISIDLGQRFIQYMQSKGLQTRNVKGNLNETGFQWHIGSMLVNNNVTSDKKSKTSCLLSQKQY